MRDIPNIVLGQSVSDDIIEATESKDWNHYLDKLVADPGGIADILERKANEA